ncbi:MAG: 26S protease regulatory subunit, partial [Armatimonadetes bacterium]|nr:26S protease regulatory subunit [Armatimonadota bacterium]
RLIELYARGLTLDVLDAGLWVRRTQGASPAFIKELLRKSALVAAMRGGDGSDLHVTDADLDQAIGEMVLGGGALTRRLLAFDEDTAA